MRGREKFSTKNQEQTIKQIERRHFLGLGLGSLALPAFGKVLDLPVTAFKQTDSARVGSYKSHFDILPGLRYFDHGAKGPVPRVATETIAANLKLLSEEPGSMWGLAFGAAEGARRKFAAFFGCSEQELLVTRNTTEGMNLLGKAVAFRRGERILTTNEEHKGGLACWEPWKKLGVIVDTVTLPNYSTTDSEILQRFEAAITSDTKMISVSHISYRSGLVLPVKEISSLARRYNIPCIVDGAQAPGIIPVNFTDIGCDAYATSLHKGMLAPLCCGLLYIRKEAQMRWTITDAGAGFSYYTDSSGLRDAPAMIGAGANLDLMTNLGIENVFSHIRMLTEHLRSGLRNFSNIEIVTPEQSTGSAFTVIELPEDFPAGDVANRLNVNHRIQVKVVPGGNRLRFSVHLHLDTADIDAAVHALGEELV